jgi:putative ABC transport system permease protein
MTNSGLETSLGRNFTGFDIDNNNYVCVVGSDFGGLKTSTLLKNNIDTGARFKVMVS